MRGYAAITVVIRSNQMPFDEDDLAVECAENWLDDNYVPWWKLLLLAWFVLT